MGSGLAKLEVLKARSSVMNNPQALGGSGRGNEKVFAYFSKRSRSYVPVSERIAM